jgi:23S rRNA (uracil1939-C5)-methyltransferase
MADNRFNKEKFRGDAMIKGEKKGEKTREKTGQRSGEKAERKSGEKTWSKAGEQTGKKYGEKSWQKSGEKTGQKYGEKAWQRDDEKTERKSGEKTWSKAGEHIGKKYEEKTWKKSGEKTGQKYGQKDWQRTDVKTERKSGEKTWSKAGEQTEKKYGEKSWQKSGEKTGQKYGEKAWQKADEKTERKLGEKTWSKSGEQAGKKFGEKTWKKSDEKPGFRAGKRSGQDSRDMDGEKNSKFRRENFVNSSNKDKKVEEKVFSRGGKRNQTQCPVFRICGGCQLLDIPYKQQLEQKQKRLEELLKPFCRLEAMIGMENPYHYRNKVHAVFDHDKKGNPFSGVYEANSHRVVPVETCLIEDQKADEIIGTIRGMLKSFKIRTYDEDTGYGLLRHVLIRRGFATGEIMVVLITASPIFPSKNNFVKALRDKHPEITTIIQNINGRGTNMVLGDKEHVLYGKGFIEDILCGYRFRISSKSFYQVNPVQTEILYKKAIEAAGLTGKERVIDAYCGIGTIGIVASQYAKEVIGVELNRDAVKDAMENAKINGLNNVKFFCNDAGKFMENMAENGEHADVVFLDPPRSGSTVEFIDSVAKLKPKKVVYVSCGPETLARDLELFRKRGYEAKKGWGVDLFPITGHCEICVEICRK